MQSSCKLSKTSLLAIISSQNSAKSHNRGRNMMLPIFYANAGVHCTRAILTRFNFHTLVSVEISHTKASWLHTFDNLRQESLRHRCIKVKENYLLEIDKLASDHENLVPKQVRPLTHLFWFAFIGLKPLMGSHFIATSNSSFWNHRETRALSWHSPIEKQTKQNSFSDTTCAEVLGPIILSPGGKYWTPFLVDISSAVSVT